jgi:hypothetical protein
MLDRDGRITIEQILKSKVGLITPDVMRMFGFPSVVIGDEHRNGTMFISAIAVDWCKQNGIGDFVNNHEEFWFNNHEDAVMFKLRWG